MALIKCKACGANVAKSAQKCMQCGQITNFHLWQVTIACVVGIIVFMYFMDFI